jgi:hypothetical protein
VRQVLGKPTQAFIKPRRALVIVACARASHREYHNPKSAICISTNIAPSCPQLAQAFAVRASGCATRAPHLILFTSSLNGPCVLLSTRSSPVLSPSLHQGTLNHHGTWISYCPNLAPLRVQKCQPSGTTSALAPPNNKRSNGFRPQTHPIPVILAIVSSVCIQSHSRGLALRIYGSNRSIFTLLLNQSAKLPCTSAPCVSGPFISEL